jgi:hypothetical protein
LPQVRQFDREYGRLFVQARSKRYGLAFENLFILKKFDLKNLVFKVRENTKCDV